jgi:hypothetical protein
MYRGEELSIIEWVWKNSELVKTECNTRQQTVCSFTDRPQCKKDRMSPRQTQFSTKDDDHGERTREATN